MSGVLGLAYNTVAQSSYGSKSFLAQASSNATSFSLYMNKNPEKSYMVVPGMDTDNYEVIKEHKITNKTYFQLNFGGVKKEDIHIKDNATTVALLNNYDGIIGPSKILEAVLDEVVVYKDCSNVD